MNNEDDTAGILILERESGGYIVILNPPKGEDVDVYIAGESNKLYRMAKTPEVASMDTFTGTKVGTIPTEQIRRSPFELVVDNG